MLGKNQQVIGLKYQSGQTMVFALVFIAVILLGLIILFNTGQLTRHKMEVQNAADAAAYSAGILYARELNFMAYTNRAMVANQVTIGQFAAFESWGRKYELGSKGLSSGFAFFYSMNAIPIVGNAISSILVTMFKTPLIGVNAFNQAISKVMMKIGMAANIFIPILQKIYVIHQKALTLGTLATQAETIPKIIDDNAKGATLSNFGALAVILSGYEQNVLTSEKFAKAGALGNQFLKTSDGTDGKHRFAAFVNDSRDGWTKDRTRDLVIGFNESLKILIAEVGISMSIGFQNIFGSTELRFLGKDEVYNWSSLDALAGGFGLRIKLKADLGLFDIKFDSGEIGTDFLPFGGASAETIQSKSKLSDRLFRDPAKWKKGDYAGTWENWKKEVPALEAITMGYQRNKNSKFGGLPDYVDINPDEKFGYAGVTSAPAFLVSVRKNGEELRTSDELDIAKGQFDVKTKLAGGKKDDGDTTEGDPATAISGWISEMTDQFKKTLTSNLDDLPMSNNPLMRTLANEAKMQATRFEKMLLDKADILITLLSKAYSGINPADDKGGVFALAQADVYFKNPDGSETVKGSTFSPYWQVRLKPVNDSIRRWSVISQGYAVKRSPGWLDEDKHLDALKALATQR